ncbi:MAG: hypothetical protein ACMXYG_06425 [Candidatus Woesearchaeota archaeon]
MGEDDYELIPHSELKKIEGEIEELRSKGAQSKSAMTPSLDELSNSIKSLLTVFTEAKNELRIEDEEKELIAKKVDPMLNKLDSLLDQNEKLAEGILSLADMIKKLDFKLQSIQASVDKPIIEKSSLDKNEKLESLDSLKEDPLSQPGMQRSPFQQSNQSPFQQPSQSFQSQQQPSPFMGQQKDPFSPPPQFASSSNGPKNQFSLPQQPQQNQSQQSFGPQPGLDQQSSDMQSSIQPSDMQNDRKPAPGGIGMPPPPPPSPQKKKSFFGK